MRRQPRYVNERHQRADARVAMIDARARDSWTSPLWRHGVHRNASGRVPEETIRPLVLASRRCPATCRSRVRACTHVRTRPSTRTRNRCLHDRARFGTRRRSSRRHLGRVHFRAGCPMDTYARVIANESFSVARRDTMRLAFVRRRNTRKHVGAIG